MANRWRLAAAVPCTLLLLEPAAAFHSVPPLGRGAAKNPPPPVRMGVSAGAAPGGFGISRRMRTRSVAVMMSEAGTLPAAENGKDGKGEPEEICTVNVATVAEQKKVRELREELARDDESNEASSRSPSMETVEETMTFEEWKKIFGDVIDPTKLKSLFDQLDGDKNGRVSMREFLNGLDGFTGGTVHPLAVKGVLQSVRLKMLDKIQDLIRQKRRLKKLKSFSGVRMYTDYLTDKLNDNEESRKYRRTIFTDEDWKRFRSEENHKS